MERYEEDVLYLAFSNLAYLFEQDLSSYKIHPVEEAYFEDVVEILKKQVDLEKSFSGGLQDFNDIDIKSFFLFPRMKKCGAIKVLFEITEEFYKNRTTSVEKRKKALHILDVLVREFSSKKPFSEFGVLAA